jgi:hypothetical protein
MLKRWVAWGAVVPGLVPAWDGEREQITKALSKAWERWSMLQANRGGLVTPSEFEALPVYVARRALAAAYWGLFPDAPVEDLVLSVKPVREFDGLRLEVLEGGNPPNVGWSE